jgi:hypothetical protein
VWCVCEAQALSIQKVMGRRRRERAELALTCMPPSCESPLWPCMHGRSPVSAFFYLPWRLSFGSRCCRRPTTKNAFISLHRFRLLFCCVGRASVPAGRTWSPTFFFLWRRRQERSGTVGSSSAPRRRSLFDSVRACPSSAPLKEKIFLVRTVHVNLCRALYIS